VLRAFHRAGAELSQAGEGTTAKDEAICEWCQRVTEATGVVWRYMRVNQAEFDQWEQMLWGI